MPLVHNSWAEMMESVVAASLKVRPNSVGIRACHQSGKERVGLVWQSESDAALAPKRLAGLEFTKY